MHLDFIMIIRLCDNNNNIVLITLNISDMMIKYDMYIVAERHENKCTQFTILLKDMLSND